MKYIMLSMKPTDPVYFLFETLRDSEGGVRSVFYSYNKRHLLHLFKLLYIIKESRFYRNSKSFKVIHVVSSSKLEELNNMGIKDIDGSDKKSEFSGRQLNMLALSIHSYSITNSLTLLKRVLTRIKRKFLYIPLLNKSGSKLQQISMRMNNYIK